MTNWKEQTKMITTKSASFITHCTQPRCRRARACRKKSQAPCAGLLAMRENLPARMARLIAALSLKIGGAK